MLALLNLRSWVAALLNALDLLRAGCLLTLEILHLLKCPALLNLRSWLECLRS
jgi:hypothetical protein